MSNRNESAMDQWHPMYMPSRKEVAERKLALEAQKVHAEKALEKEVGEVYTEVDSVVDVDSTHPVVTSLPVASNNGGTGDGVADDNEQPAVSQLEKSDLHEEQQEEGQVSASYGESGETPVLEKDEEDQESAKFVSISPVVPPSKVDETSLHEQVEGPVGELEVEELAEEVEPEKVNIAQESDSLASEHPQSPVVDTHTTIPIPQLQDATSAPFRTAGTLDENPFEMTGEEDVSWIGAATNDPISPADSPAWNAKDDGLFGESSDNFLSQLHQPASLQADEQLKKQPSEGLFGSEEHVDSFFVSPSNLPNQEIKEKKSSIAFDDDDDSFFAKPESPLKLSNPSPQTLQPSPMSKTEKRKGHLRMTSVFISGNDATNDDFFSSLSPEPQELSNLLNDTNQSAADNNAVNDTTELFGKDDETFDLGATESKQADDLFGSTNEEFSIQGVPTESSPAAQAEKEGPKFAFLGEEDDLLLSEDDDGEEDDDVKSSAVGLEPPSSVPVQEQVASQPVVNKYAPQPAAAVPQPTAKHHTPIQPHVNQFSKFSTPSMSSMYSPATVSPYAPHANQPPQTLKTAKSFMNDHRAGSAYDPPTDITPRPTAQVRRVGSFQPAINTPSPYAPHQPAAAAPVQQKPFYEELPPMAIKAPPARPRQSIDSLAHHQRAPPSIYNKPQPSTSATPFVPPPNPYEAAVLSPPAPAQPPLAYNQVAPAQQYPGVVSPQNQHRPLHASQSMTVLQSPMNAIPQPMPPQQLPYAAPAQQQQSPYAPPRQASIPASVPSAYAPAPQPVLSHVNQYAPAPGTPPSRYAPMVHQHQPATSFAQGHSQAPTSPYQRAAAAQQPQQYGRYSPRQVSPPLSRAKPSQPLPSGGPPLGGPRAVATAAYGDLPSDITQAIPRHDYSPPRNRVQSPPQVIPPGYQTNGRIPESLNLRQNQQIMEMQRQQQSQQQLMQAQSQQHRQSIAAPLSASDNEMLTRRQFPVFRWSYSKRAVMVVPPKIAYTGGASAEVRVIQVTDILGSDNLLQKFPVPLVGKSGPVKSKKKELEGWMKDKIAILEQKVDNQGLADGVGKRMDHKVLLWKIVHLILTSDCSPSKAVADQLAEIRTILVPGIPDLKDGKDDEANFKSVTDMYNAGRSPQSVGGHAEASLSPDDLRAILSDLEVGNRDGALRKALERKLWAHALAIASSMSTEQWHSTVAEFVREDVRNLDPPASQSLALMYRVFAGAGADSVAELGSQKYDSSSNWRQHLCLILSNPSAKNPAAINALGKQLEESGLVEAAQICFVLSGNIGFFGMSDAENQRVEIMGANSQSRDLDNILLSEIWEFITFSHAASELNTPLSCYPHLLIYKLVHASELADLGHLSEAQRVCEGVLAIVKHHDQIKGPKYQRAFLQQLENVSQRVNNADASSAGGSGWFGGKLAKPDVNKIWTRFVTGDDEEEVHTSSEKESIFKSLNTAGDRPALSRVQSHADLPGVQHRQHPYSNSSSGSDHYPLGQYAPLNESIARTQSHSQLPHSYAPVQPLRAVSPYNQVGSQGSSSRVASRASSVGGGGYEQQPLQPLQQLSQVEIPRPPSSHMPVAPPVSKTPDLPSASAPLTGTPSPARRTAPASISNSPRGPLQRPVNPYAPVSATNVTATVKTRTSNKYAPVAESIGKATHDTEHSALSDLPSETVDIYGYMSGSPAIQSATVHASHNGQYEQQPMQEVREEVDDDDEGAAAASENDNSNGYQPYEPPSYGYQPPDNEPADYATDDVPSADYFSPMSSVPSFAPQAPAVSHSNTPQRIPEEEEVEDLGFGNAAKAEERSDDEKEDKEDASKDSKGGKDGKDGTGWFKWLRGGAANPADKQKAIKAKLGGENEFYFDKELGRWVNPKVALEETKSKPPPPPKSARPASVASNPPSTSGPPTRSASTMNLAPGSGSGTPPPSFVPPPGIPKSASVSDLNHAPRPAIPKTAASASAAATTLDDLLGGNTPPPISSGAARKKRSARSKYVDIVQQTQK